MVGKSGQGAQSAPRSSADIKAAMGIEAVTGKEAVTGSKAVTGRPARRRKLPPERIPAIGDIVMSCFAAQASPAMRRARRRLLCLFTYWADIVGPDHACRFRPLRLRPDRRAAGQARYGTQHAAEEKAQASASGGVLYVETDSASALLLAMEREPLVERINGYFGCRLVKDIRPAPPAMRRARQRPAHMAMPHDQAATFRPSGARSDQQQPADGQARQTSRRLAAIGDERLRAALSRLGAEMARRLGA